MMAGGTHSYAASSCSTTSGEGQSTDAHIIDKMPSGTKRRASRAGTRSVSTLTPAQLQRKRANDREAQRAIRQRNKEHIESLERRIEELSIGNVDAATLVQLRQRVKDLEDELSKANENLAASRSQQISTHPVWQSSRNGELANSPPPYNSHSGMVVNGRTGDYRISAGQDYASHCGSFANGHGLIVGDSEDTKDFILNDDAEIHRNWAQPGLGYEQSQNMAYTTQAPFTSHVPSIFSAAYGQAMSSSFMSQPSLHAYDLLIRFAPPTGTTDYFLISLLQTQRRLATNSTAQLRYDILKPDMGGLIPRDARIGFSPLPLDRVSGGLAQLVGNTVGFAAFPERAAALYITYKLLMWQISPSTSTLAALPEFYVPTACQLSIPHPVWVTLMVWPKMRQKLITSLDLYGDGEFLTLYLANYKVNWPDYQNIVEVVDGRFRLTAVFERHICNVENWSMDVPFQQRYPEFRDCCRFSDATKESFLGITQ